MIPPLSGTIAAKLLPAMPSVILIIHAPTITQQSTDSRAIGMVRERLQRLFGAFLNRRFLVFTTQSVGLILPTKESQRVDQETNGPIARRVTHITNYECRLMNQDRRMIIVL